MTNQDAQTMPECTCRDNEGCTKPCDRKACQPVPLTEELLIEAAILSGDTPQEKRLQKVLTQAAAALAQTAGVPEGWTREDLQDLYDRLVSAGISKFMEGSSSKVRDREFIRRAITEAWGLIGDMLAAAPAASGGEVSHVTIDFPQVGTAGPFKVIDGRMTLPDVTMNDLIHHARMGYAPAPNPPAATSVSERARALLAQAYSDAGWIDLPEFLVRDNTPSQLELAALRAIEQALTQQRGDDFESAARALFEAQADPLAASWDRQWEPTKAYWRLVARGYHVNADGVLTQPAYVSVHCGLADFTDYFVKNYPGPDTIIHDPKWHAPRIFGAARRAIMASPEYAAATTPQPSADAVREIYDAAAKGFHTSETNGAERKYLHVIRFQSIEDLHGYEDAWTAAMVKARDAK